MRRTLLAVLVACALAPPVSKAQTPYAAPRTPWGHPDFQGVWTTDDARTVPLQRPPELGDKALLTDAEFAARAQRDTETRGDVAVAAGTFVGEVGTRSLRQTSLVVAHGNGLRIVQGPDMVVISHEMIHETRVIPLDGRRPPAAALRAHMGYASGRWEGDTLVLETRGFADKTAIGGTRHTAALRVVERLTRTAPDTITYRATVEDPNTWAGGWTVEIPFSTQPGYQVFPYECHEGNNALRNMLSAARAEERVIEEYTKKGLPAPPLARPNDGDILPRDPSSGRAR